MAVALACSMLCTLPLAAGVASGRRYIHWTTVDGIGGVLLGLIVGEDTGYTTGYSDEGWRSIRVGMTEEDVHGILGAPQNRRRLDPGLYHLDEQQFTERWSWSPNDTNFRCRVIQFQRGRVVAIHSGFYLD
jgi:hypothetical protein